MPKRIPQMFAVVVTALALSLNAAAQPQEQIHQHPEFIKMLELTPQQVTGLQRVWREAAELGKTIRAQTQTLEEARQYVLRREATIQSEWQTKIDEVLKPEQRKKYSRVGFQVTGGLNKPTLGWGMNEWTLGFLDLTNAQKERVRKLVEEREAWKKVLSDELDGLPVLEARNRFVEARKEGSTEFLARIKSVLTAEQWAKMEKLTAESPALRERLGLPALPRYDWRSTHPTSPPLPEGERKENGQCQPVGSISLP